jgi:hypothetical protein
MNRFPEPKESASPLAGVRAVAKSNPAKFNRTNLFIAFMVLSICVTGVLKENPQQGKQKVTGGGY